MLSRWLIVFLILMLVNRDRLRAGDLIAGTLVIVMPRQRWDFFSACFAWGNGASTLLFRQALHADKPVEKRAS